MAPTNLAVFLEKSSRLSFLSFSHYCSCFSMVSDWVDLYWVLWRCLGDENRSFLIYRFCEGCLRSDHCCASRLSCYTSWKLVRRILWPCWSPYWTQLFSLLASFKPNDYNNITALSFIKTNKSNEKLPIDHPDQQVKKSVELNVSKRKLLEGSDYWLPNWSVDYCWMG